MPSRKREEERIPRNQKSESIKVMVQLFKLQKTGRLVPRNAELCLRMAIFYVYMDVLGARKKTVWNGPDGAIKIIGLIFFV